MNHRIYNVKSKTGLILATFKTLTEASALVYTLSSGYCAQGVYIHATNQG